MRSGQWPSDRVKSSGRSRKNSVPSWTASTSCSTSCGRLLRNPSLLLESFDDLVARVNADHGWLPSWVGGESWGAITSCWIAKNRATLADGTPLIGFNASTCPVVLGNIAFADSELIFPFSTTGADLGTVNPLATPYGTYASTYLNGITVPGYVAFGSGDVTVYPGGCSAMVQAALAAGAPLQSRYTDGVITGGTTFTSIGFCGGGPSEDGAAITGPGIPNGTTVSGISPVPSGGSNAPPWTMTLSQACTNVGTTAITAVQATGTQVTYTAAAHGFSVGQYVSITGFTDSNPTAFGVTREPSGFNVRRAQVVAATANTLTINSICTGTVTSGRFGVVGASFNFPDLAPSYNNAHIVWYGEEIDILAWVAAALDPNYPMAL